MKKIITLFFFLLLIACTRTYEAEMAAPPTSMYAPPVSLLREQGSYLFFNSSQLIALQRQYQHHGDYEYYLVPEQPVLIRLERHNQQECYSEVRYITERDHELFVQALADDHISALAQDSSTQSRLYLFRHHKQYESLPWSQIEPQNISESIRTPHFKIFDGDECFNTINELDRFLDTPRN